MSVSVPTLKDQSILLFTQQERDFYVNNWGRSPGIFAAAPNWVLALHGLQGEFYAIPGFGLKGDADNDGEADFWKSYFAPPPAAAPKPGFLEIFTNSQGVLSGEEVRQAAKDYGYGNVASGPAVSAYNNDLEQDEKLYTEDLSMVEMHDRLTPEAYARLQVVHAGITEFLGAEPVYFEFEIPTHVDGKSVEFEGIRFVLEKTVRRDKQICFAFAGQRALVRDVFDIPNVAPTGPKYLQPGRDRWYRNLSHGAFATYLHSPVFALTQMQLAQSREGRSLATTLSSILRPEMLVWGDPQ